MSDALLSTLPGAERPGEPSWLAHLRREAADRLRTGGFPTGKTEAWRFTPVAPVTSVAFQPAAEASVGAVPADLADDGTFHLLVVNGVPQPATALPAGLEVEPLGDVLSREPAAVQAHLGRYARAEHFAALNAAMFSGGLVVRARGRVERPVHVVHVGVPGDGPTAAYPRLLVVVEDGAELELVESYRVLPGERHLTGAVTEIAVGAGAVVDHVRVQEGGPGGYHVASLAVRQGRDSSYTSRVITLGGALSRLDVDLALAGEGASAVLDGVYHAGKKEHVDHYIRVDHESPRCTSNQEYRGLVGGAGHAVFDGIVFVRKDSQQTSAHQQNHNLLLDDGATVHTKPHLEIDADDVSCSHGATIGALAPEQLFYLRARGVGAEKAEAILTYAFVKELLDRIRQPAIRDRLTRTLLSRLPHGDAIGDLE